MAVDSLHGLTAPPDIEGMTLQRIQRVLTLIGTWAGFGLMLWLLARIWPALLALGG